MLLYTDIMLQCNKRYNRNINIFRISPLRYLVKFYHKYYIFIVKTVQLKLFQYFQNYASFCFYICKKNHDKIDTIQLKPEKDLCPSCPQDLYWSRNKHALKLWGLSSKTGKKYPSAIWKCLCPSFIGFRWSR